MGGSRQGGEEPSQARMGMTRGPTWGSGGGRWRERMCQQGWVGGRSLEAGEGE